MDAAVAPTGDTFEVSDTGRVTAATPRTAEIAASVLYVAQVADAAGYSLGAGPLVGVEVVGPTAIVATVDLTAKGTQIRGVVDASGEPVEVVRNRLDGRPVRAVS